MKQVVFIGVGNVKQCMFPALHNIGLFCPLKTISLYHGNHLTKTNPHGLVVINKSATFLLMRKPCLIPPALLALEVINARYCPQDPVTILPCLGAGSFRAGEYDGKEEI